MTEKALGHTPSNFSATPLSGGFCSAVYLLSVLCGVFERVAVAQRDKAVYAVYRLCRNKAAMVYSEKIIAKLVLKLGKGHSCFVYAPVRQMNISVLLFISTYSMSLMGII